MWRHSRTLRWLASAAIFVIVACGGMGNPPKSANSSNAPIANICDCSPSQPASEDFRHAAKHVGLPGPTGQEITVADILGWPQGPSLPPDAPRSGRELQEFHIAHAWLQLAWANPGDCDLHLEISDVPGQAAPRVIVETPIDSEFCAARRTLQQQLAAHGFVLNNNSGQLPQPLQVEVLGLAFQDFEHQRGSQFVATVWELHPAIVSVTQ